MKGLRLAWSPRLGGDVPVDPEIAALTRAAALAFRDLGATVEEVDPGFDDPIETLMTIWSAGAALALRSAGPDGARAAWTPASSPWRRPASAVAGPAYVDALLNQRNALAHHMAQFHARFDLLLTPTLPLPAFAVGAQHARRTAPMATTGRAGRPSPTRSTSPRRRRSRCPAV